MDCSASPSPPCTPPALWLARQSQSARREPAPRLLQAWTKHQPPYCPCSPHGAWGIVRQSICRVHEYLALRGPSRHLKVELGPGKPQRWVAGPEVGKLAALLMQARLRGHRRLSCTPMHVNQICQERVVVEKLHALLFSGSPIVAKAK